jgi:IclR family KDG regulon transcriptional repressor
MAERLIQSVERAADVLELFLTSSSDLSVKEISEELSLSKSTAHGIIKTLEHRGYLEQNPIDLKYKLGLKLFELGIAVENQLDVGRISRPIIENLVAKLKETVHLVVLQRDEVIYIEKVEGPQTLRISSQVGKRAPIHCTGVGKAILAFQSEAEIDRILSMSPLEPYTEFTLTDKEEIKKQLKTIHQQGFSVDDEEIELGLRCVAAPIFNHQAKAIASVSCAAPTMRLEDEQLSKVIEGIKQAASEISRCMGYKIKPTT